MGYLLKEALKTLCGVNQWSYAVFWKIGFQNPKLLIWEECYYEPMVYANSLLIPAGVGATENKVHFLVTKMMTDNYINLLGEGLVGRAAFTGNHQWIFSESFSSDAHPPEVSNEACLQFSAGIQTIAVIPVLPHGVIQLGSSLNVMENMGFVNDVRTLVLQLGCVPGALLSENYERNEPSPKTAPHTDPLSKMPIYLGQPVSDPSDRSKKIDYISYVFDRCNQQGYSSQASGLRGQSSYSLLSHVQDSQHTTSSKFQIPSLTQISVESNNDHYQVECTPMLKQNIPFGSQLTNGVTGAAVIPSNADLWLSEGANMHENSKNGDAPAFDSLAANYGSSRSMEGGILSNDIFRDHINDSLSTSSSFVMSQKTNELQNCVGGPLKLNLSPSSLSDMPKIAMDTSFMHTAESGKLVESSKTEVASSKIADHLPRNHFFSGRSDFRHESTDESCMQNDLHVSKLRLEHGLFKIPCMSSAPPSDMSLSGHIPGFVEGRRHDYGCQVSTLKTPGNAEAGVTPPLGDDLFDIFGVDFRNKLFDGSWNNIVNNGPEKNTDLQNLNRNNGGVLDLDYQGASSDLFSVDEGETESGIFSTTTDHLLEAVVSKVRTSSKQSSDDNVSCRTTLTRTSSSTTHIPSSFGRVNGFSLMQGELVGVSKSVAKAGALLSCTPISGVCKEDGGCYSDTNSMYGSQISSWVEQGNAMKQNSGASTAYSKKTRDSGKSNRKRLKPEESPRPRPKDRQMIQDRVKELREIIPHGAKCSIDALLERTIKHMLFLQSVTKHADKLKQTGESKIISKDGGLLKDSFEGGATWAYEVGSQSTVCPIIVEDLSTPRQMLVEMLCEERGLFLEIADIIRGLGLTILKGVMEARNEKIWARFTVEANRDVTRMEIFISLVRLLEQTVKSSAAASANYNGNDNIALHQSFPQGSSVPATGRPYSLL